MIPKLGCVNVQSLPFANNAFIQAHRDLCILSVQPILRKLFTNTVKVLLLVCITPLALAEELIFIPNLFISARNFDYSARGGNVSTNLKSVGLGLTTIYDRYYLNLSGEENPETQEELTGSAPLNQVNIDRTDLALSAGYAVNHSISTFVGYKYGKTTLTELPFSSRPHAKTSLEGKGFFVGAGGGWQVKNWGTFAFSAAYVDISAVFRDPSLKEVLGNPMLEEVTGDASGTSLAIKWKANLSKNWQYDISVIRHDYYYQDQDFARFDSDDIDDISEQVLSFRLGLSYLWHW